MISDSLNAPWPPEVVQGLAAYRQGDLIERPPFFYWGDGRHPLWRPTGADLAADEDDVVVIEDDAFTHGIITTQTCDLRGLGSLKKPWAMVAPVYHLEGDPNGIRAQIERGAVAYLTRVTAIENDFAVADTRIEFPVEKGYLVGRTPQRGFRTEDEALQFADKLAECRRRPALANDIYELLLVPLKERLANAQPDEQQQLLENLWEIRLRIEGDRTEPIAVQLVVFTSGPATAEQREWFEDSWDASRLAAADRLNIFAAGLS